MWWSFWNVFRWSGTFLDIFEIFSIVLKNISKDSKTISSAENYKVTPKEICKEMGLAASGEGQNRFKLNVGGLGDVFDGNNTYNY